MWRAVLLEEKAVTILEHTAMSNLHALIPLLSISKGLAETEFHASIRWTKKTAWKKLRLLKNITCYEKIL